MRVSVGSGNPVKVAAVEDALAPLDPVVSAAAVDSGVPEQPRSVVETIEGAENRARRAYERGLEERGIDDRGAVADDVGTDADETELDGGVYGVGIEGGVADLAAPGTFLVMWAAVTDGNRLERGAGPSLRLPDEVAARVNEGAELGPVLADLLDAEGVARREGAAGVFTGGLTDRRASLAQAVACAFGPFQSEYSP